MERKVIVVAGDWRKVSKWVQVRQWIGDVSEVMFVYILMMKMMTNEELNGIDVEEANEGTCYLSERWKCGILNFKSE